MQLKRFKKVLIFTTILLAIISLYYIYDYVTKNKSLLTNTRHNAIKKVKNEANKLNDEFNKIVKQANSIANDLSASKIQKENLSGLFKDMLKEHPKLHGIGVAYIPNINDEAKRKSPYYISNNNYKQEEILQVYSTAIQYVDEKSGKNIVTGELFFDYKKSDIKKIIESLSFGQTGYSFILSKNGTFIDYPIDEYVQKQKTVFELSDEINDYKLREIGEYAIYGNSGVTEHTSELTGKSSWMFYEPIKSVGWSLVAVFIKDEIKYDVDYLRRKLILIGALLLCLISLASALFLRVYEVNIFKLWSLVAVYTISSFAFMGFIWYLALNYYSVKKDDTIQVVEKTGTSKVLSNRVDTRILDNKLYIPTGIMVHTIEFTSASNVSVTGFVWQKYKKDSDFIDKGIVFPEASSTAFDIAYNYNKDEEEVIGWFFKATFRESFDYSRYPFDIKDVWLRMWPKDFKNNVVLLPDFDSYKLTNPSSLPGLIDDVCLPGWEIKKSNFEYKKHTYNTNYGVSVENLKAKSAELYFNINMKRNFLDPFVSNIIPLLVMMLVMFILMTISGKETVKLFRILATCATFFFTVILAHVSLRNRLGAQEIVYFEYYYFLMYFVILLVTLNIVIFNQTDKFAFFEYKNNIIFKLIYWPIIVTTSIIFSVFLFY